MASVSEVITKGAKYVEVVQDNYPDSPREWENLGTMLCFTRKYNLGDSTDFNKNDFSNWDEVKEAIIENGGKYIAPLYLYDHGGISISIGSFIGKAPHAEWDSGQIGFIYTTEKDIASTGISIDDIESALSNEVEIYDKYLRGETYGYKIMEQNTCPTCHNIEREEIEACYGYYSEEAAREAGEAEL